MLNVSRVLEMTRLKNMQSLKIFFPLAVAFFLISCETIPLDQNKKKDIRRVGVISIVGDEVRIQRNVSLRQAFLSNKGFTINQDPGWDFNSLVNYTVELTFKEKTDLELVRLSYDFRKLEDMYSSSAFSSEINASNHKQQLRKIISGKNVDSIVLVSQCNCPDVVGGDSNDLITGVGLYSKDWGSGEMQYATFAAIRITLVDPKTFEVIATQRGLHYINQKDDRLWTRDLKLTDPEIQQLIRKLLSIHVFEATSQVITRWELGK